VRANKSVAAIVMTLFNCYDPVCIKQLMKQMKTAPRYADIGPHLVEHSTDKERLGSEQIEILKQSASLVGSSKSCMMHITTSYEDVLTYSPTREEDLEAGRLVGIHALIRNINKVMDGKVFLCRSVAPSTKIVSFGGVAEDPKGNKAVELGLYNIFSANAELGVTDFEDVLPIGMFIAIKNPFLKTSGNNCELIVRCDNPAEIEFISEKKMREKFPSKDFLLIFRQECFLYPYIMSRYQMAGQASSISY
jgi:hypothetical protein